MTRRGLLAVAIAGLVGGGLLAVPFSGDRAAVAPSDSSAGSESSAAEPPGSGSASATDSTTKSSTTTSTVPRTTTSPSTSTTVAVLQPPGTVPTVDAQAYVVYDVATGTLLAERDADRPAPVGSLIKLLTAYVVMQAGDPEREVTVPTLQLDPLESQIGLIPGEVLSRAVLLRAMMIVSANDAARTLAIDVGGTEDQFVAMMNDAAATLGLSGTLARNPTGLDSEGQQSTARDVLTLAVSLMDDPTFRATVARVDAGLHGQRFAATNDLLRSYSGADGIKTGRTTNAGFCLAGSATRDGRQVFVVVLGSSSDVARVEATSALLDWAFSGAAAGA